jgi:hypothetical protein
MTRFGLIARIKAHPGKGDALAEVLLDQMQDAVQVGGLGID